MNSNERTTLSRTLSKILRHKAIDEGLTIRPDGFIDLSSLLLRPKLIKLNATVERVKEVVEKDNKSRFTLRDDHGTIWIRANQGHSIVVDDLELRPLLDPSEYPTVVHGTSLEAWKSIEREGLKKQGRNHIHLASGLHAKSGVRKNCQVFIYIDLQKALEDGILFWVSSNGVILTTGSDGTLPRLYFSKVEGKDGSSLVQDLNHLSLSTTADDKGQVNSSDDKVNEPLNSNQNMVKTQMNSKNNMIKKDLYGGHMSALIPASWLDASDFRQIPDTQEVYLPPDSENVSLIIELVEAPPGDLSLSDAIREHYKTLAEDNEASVSHLKDSVKLSSQAGPAILVHGTQQVSKFNSQEKDLVHVTLGLLRLARAKTDVLVSFNSAGTIEANGTTLVTQILESLAVNDWSLFPDL